MTQILFIQGAGKNVHEQWDDKLAASLRRELGKGFEIRYPRMPNEDDPKVVAWGDVIVREMTELQSGAIVVGHSIGGTILINVLAERGSPVSLGAIVLISAPFIGDGGWKSEEIRPHSDLGARVPKGVPVMLYHGDKDTTAPIAHVELYAAAIPLAQVRRLADRDHQLNNGLTEVARDIRDLEAGLPHVRGARSGHRR